MGNRLVLAVLYLVLTGCSSSLVMKTDKDFNGDIQIGYGPSTVISGKAVGGMTLCRIGQEMPAELIEACRQSLIEGQ